MTTAPQDSSTPAAAQGPDSITLARPDDWHLHVRDGDVLADVVPASARQFGRALIMPNLRPPVTTAALAVAYRERIQAAIPPGSAFKLSLIHI